MAEAARNLQYYLNHPDEMPTDPADLERLANEQIAQTLESGKDEVSVERFVGQDEKPESSPAAKPEVTEAAAAKVEAAPEVKAETPPEGVLAKDGKNVIPYAVLEAARRREQEAVALATEQAAELERLRAEAAGKQQAAQQESAALTDEELKTLEGESPTLAKLLRAQQDEIRSLKEQFEVVNERVTTQAEREAGDTNSEIQTAVESLPKLAAYQVAEDQTMWNEVAKQDRILRENPLYADTPYALRFAKALSLAEDVMGVAEEKQTAAQPAKPNPAAVRAAAAQKLAARPATPLSLSDIPGGAPPAKDERERVENASIVSLGEQFMHMTPEQRDAYLASL